MSYIYVNMIAPVTAWKHIGLAVDSTNCTCDYTWLHSLQIERAWIPQLSNATRAPCFDRSTALITWQGSPWHPRSHDPAWFHPLLLLKSNRKFPWRGEGFWVLGFLGYDVTSRPVTSTWYQRHLLSSETLGAVTSGHVVSLHDLITVWLTGVFTGLTCGACGHGGRV